MPHALIVEDDPNSAEMLATLVKGEEFSVAIAHNLKEARQQLAFRAPDVVLLDLVLPDGTGMDLFEDREEFGNLEIILITGHATVDTSIQAMRLGAADYLIKPIDVQVLKGALSRIGRPAEAKAEIATLQKASESDGRFGRLWGRSPAMQTVYAQIGRVAPTAVTVMITGESGTGKEVVAQTLHDLSRRRKEPFLAVNCGAISPNLIESEIFGHEKGSFTGANRQHRGFFERAHGGTMFLDEVTEMPLDLQVKLLRVLETGTFMRVGSSDELIVTDVRIVAATNRNPHEAVHEGKLREDLFYRLNVFQVHLPPLRERLEDLPLLANHFLAALNETEGSAKTFDPHALARLGEHDWPGNVRELRNVVQRAYIMAEGTTIGADDLPFDSSATRLPRRSEAPAGEPAISVPLGATIAEVEREFILATLAHVNGHKERAAEMLGISLKTLYNRLRQYDGDTAAPGRD